MLVFYLKNKILNFFIRVNDKDSANEISQQIVEQLSFVVPGIQTGDLNLIVLLTNFHLHFKLYFPFKACFTVRHAIIE